MPLPPSDVEAVLLTPDAENDCRYYPDREAQARDIIPGLFYQLLPLFLYYAGWGLL